MALQFKLGFGNLHPLPSIGVFVCLFACFFGFKISPEDIVRANISLDILQSLDIRFLPRKLALLVYLLCGYIKFIHWVLKYILLIILLPPLLACESLSPSFVQMNSLLSFRSFIVTALRISLKLRLK